MFAKSQNWQLLGRGTVEIIEIFWSCFCSLVVKAFVMFIVMCVIFQMSNIDGIISQNMGYFYNKFHKNET